MPNWVSSKALVLQSQPASMPERIARTGIRPEDDPLSPGELLWFRVGVADVGDGGIEASMTEGDGAAVDQIGALIYCHSNRRKDQSLRAKSDKSSARERGEMNLDENDLSRPTTILTNCKKLVVPSKLDEAGTPHSPSIYRKPNQLLRRCA